MVQIEVKNGLHVEESCLTGGSLQECYFDVSVFKSLIYDRSECIRITSYNVCYTKLLRSLSCAHPL